jgi:Carbohydrate esterase 2 N-terminal/GDSL-like Lipase/Acylhydrolase family
MLAVLPAYVATCAAVSLVAGAKPSFHAGVSPYDHRIVYVGRWDRRSTVGPRGAWPGVEVRLKLHGAGLQVTIDDTGPDWLQVEVDGAPTRGVQLQRGVQTLEVRMDRPGMHTVSFTKRTEALVGAIQFLDFEPESGRLLESDHKKRLFQVIGDSMTCGFGNEAGGPNEPFKPDTEDAYQTYGLIASRALDSDAEIIAWSGRKMWPDETIGSIYDLNVPSDPSSSFDFRSDPPEAILINIGTDDFKGSAPDEAEWTGAYKDFIGRLRFHYPKSFIYPAVGCMLSDTYPEGRQARTTMRNYLMRMVDGLRQAGDKRIRVFEFSQQREEDGYGCGYNPSVKTNQFMAVELEDQLKRDLRW